MTNAEAWFNIALRPRKPEELVRTGQPRTATSTLTQLLNCFTDDSQNDLINQQWRHLFSGVVECLWACDQWWWLHSTSGRAGLCTKQGQSGAFVLKTVSFFGDKLRRVLHPPHRPPPPTPTPSPVCRISLSDLWQFNSHPGEFISGDIPVTYCVSVDLWQFSDDTSSSQWRLVTVQPRYQSLIL